MYIGKNSYHNSGKHFLNLSQIQCKSDQISSGKCGHMCVYALVYMCRQTKEQQRQFWERKADWGHLPYQIPILIISQSSKQCELVSGQQSGAIKENWASKPISSTHEHLPVDNDGSAGQSGESTKVSGLGTAGFPPRRKRSYPFTTAQ